MGNDDPNDVKFDIFQWWIIDLTNLTTLTKDVELVIDVRNLIEHVNVVKKCVRIEKYKPSCTEESSQVTVFNADGSYACTYVFCGEKIYQP